MIQKSKRFKVGTRVKVKADFRKRGKIVPRYDGDMSFDYLVKIKNDFGMIYYNHYDHSELTRV